MIAKKNASKRFLEKFRKDYPCLKVIVIEDGISSNGPHILHLEQYHMKYLLVAKPGDHEYLFDLFDHSADAEYTEVWDEKGSAHQFKFLNNVSLNKTHKDLKINLLEYRQTDKKGKEIYFSWVTNIPITKDNVYQLMKGARSRWKIENETFNTLKTLGYNFEHNYGHGKHYLSTVFCLLMMLSFLIDQTQEIACKAFQEAKRYQGTYYGLWETMRILFQYIEITSWESFFRIITKKNDLNST